MGIHEFKQEVKESQAHTRTYINNHSFNRKWSGTTNPTSFKMVHQQQQQLSESLHPKWEDLSKLKILDFGCGKGFRLKWCEQMGANNKNLYGIDVSEEHINEGQNLYPNLNIKPYNGHDIDFEDGYFDLIMCWVVFSAIPNEEYRKYIANKLYSKLSKGGYIFWWDLPRMVIPSEKGQPNKHELLWPNLHPDLKGISQNSKPSEGIRGLRGLKKIISPLVDSLAYPDSHVCGLLGPKY